MSDLFSQNVGELLHTVLLHVLPDQFIFPKRSVDVVLSLHRCAKVISQNKLFLFYYLNTFNELKKKQGEEANPCHLHLP